MSAGPWFQTQFADRTGGANYGTGARRSATRLGVIP